MKAMPLILIFLIRIANAADVAVTLTADKTSVTPGDSIQLQVSAQGTRENVTPEILNAENFDVQATGTSSQMQFINGVVNQQIMFGFVLSPKSGTKVGKYRIGPARVTADGKPYESAQLEVTVEKEASPQAGQPRSSYVVGEVDNKTPFVRQQINYTFKFFNRSQVANARLGLPDFKGFFKEGPDEQKESEQIINGVRWHMTALRYALFPISPGPIPIEPARLAADEVLQDGRPDSIFQGFFAPSRTKRVNLNSEPLQIMVNPLPPNGRPANFSGLVGEFTLTESLGKQAVAVGDSSTLTVKIEGNGNLRDFALPELKSQDFKLYDDQPAFDITPSSKAWIGKKTFKRALVPTKAGELEIPPLDVSYFDTKTSTYKTLGTEKLRISAAGQLAEDSVHHVGPSGETNSKKSIEVVGIDLMPIKRSPSALRSDILSPYERWILLIFIFSSVPCYAVFLAVKRRRGLLMSDTGLLRKRKALRDFNSGLKTLTVEGAFFPEASLLLREYLGNKFNLDGKAITPIDAQRKLSPRGLSKNSITQIETFLRECEAGQFGGLGDKNNSSYRDRLITIVQEIEKGRAGQ